ncbi:MMPL family transporter, partial [Singulisphaera rosea]
MRLEHLSRVVIRRPGWVVSGWLLVAVVVALAAPDLTKLAADGQANLLPKKAESSRMAALIAKTWPEQSYESMAVAVLHRPTKLTKEDSAYADRLARQFEASGRPRSVLRVLGRHSDPDVAGRLVSHDGTTELVAVPL